MIKKGKYREKLLNDFFHRNSHFFRSPNITDDGVNYIANSIQNKSLENLQILSLTFW